MECHFLRLSPDKQPPCLPMAPLRSNRGCQHFLLQHAVSSIDRPVIASLTKYSILNVGWLSFYCRTPQERSVAMALVVMAANCAGIAGSQIFRTSDAPKYLHGLTASTALAGASWGLCLLLGVQYYFHRKKAVATDEETKTQDS